METITCQPKNDYYHLTSFGSREISTDCKKQENEELC